MAVGADRCGAADDVSDACVRDGRARPSVGVRGGVMPTWGHVSEVAASARREHSGATVLSLGEGASPPTFLFDAMHISSPFLCV